jgi:hypothetical protein
MSHSHSRAFRVLPLVLGLTAALGACSDESPVGPGTPDPARLLVLNSTGQTLAPFAVEGDLATAGTTIDLGPAFDGQALAVHGNQAAAAVSSFGGSLVVRIDLASGRVTNVPFPEPEGADTNPSAPSFDDEGVLWVAGRGSDALYRLDPAATAPVRVADGLGSWIERVLPVGDLLYAMDANIDDIGFTFAPLGPGRVVVLRRDGSVADEISLPDGVVNAFDAVVSGDLLVVLATGSFGEDFAPRQDGNLVVVRLSDRSIRDVLPLQANGIGIELGADGKVYVTTTRDYNRTEVVRYDPSSGTFTDGPGSGVEVTDESGAPVACWVATALADGRVLCATFSTAEAGRLVMTDVAGVFVDEVSSGFGTTDLTLR